MIDTYFEKLKTALAKPNDYIGQISDYMKTGVLPQKETQPEVNPLETEIQGLKDKNFSYDDVNSAIDIDESIQDKPTAKDFASKVYGMAKQGFQKFKDISGGTENERIIAKMSKGEKLTMEEISHLGTGADFSGGLRNVARQGVKKVAQKVVPKVFEGFQDLSTKILEKLKGRIEVSKQFISDLTNAPDLKQPERDLIRKVVGEYEGQVPVKEFANKVKTELLELKGAEGVGSRQGYPRYENISLSDEVRGPIAKYQERIYESKDIKTSAGEVHFSGGDYPNYFAHTRIEDLPAEGSKGTKLQRTHTQSGTPYDITRAKGTGDTRRVIELQSDLFQKGRLEESILDKSGYKPSTYLSDQEFLKSEPKGNITKFTNQFNKAKEQLKPYRNTWHERIIREEVKQASIDGKTKLQFPTGETAMKIEGLGELGRNRWRMRIPDDIGGSNWLTPKVEDLKVGREITQGYLPDDPQWIITDILGDGKFKAVQKTLLESKLVKGKLSSIPDSMKETFDISGRIDTNNPIYRFYEKEVGRYLTNKYGAKLITDPQGVKWWEVNIKPEMEREPITAYGFGRIGNIVAGAGTAIGGSLAAPYFLGKGEERLEQQRNAKQILDLAENGKIRESLKLLDELRESGAITEELEKGLLKDIQRIRDDK